MSRSKIIAWASSLGFVLFLVIVFVLHFLRPDKNIFSCFVGEYAVGNYSWLMTTGFYILAVAAISLLTGLLLRTNTPANSEIKKALQAFLDNCRFKKLHSKYWLT